MSTLPSSAVRFGDGEITIADLTPSSANKASPVNNERVSLLYLLSKARGGLPAPGFFDCAARRGASMAMRQGRKPGLSTPRSSTPWSRSGRRAGALARAA